MKYKYLGFGLLAIGLTACSSTEDSDGTPITNDTNSGDTGSETVNVENNFDVTETLRHNNPANDYKIGGIVVPGSASLFTFQAGKILVGASNSSNHIIADLYTNEAIFYEILDSDYPQIADVSGTGTLQIDPTSNGNDTNLLGTVRFENEPASTFSYSDSTENKDLPTDVSMIDLSNTYTQYFGPYDHNLGRQEVGLTITINSLGQLTGSSTSGCVLNGTVDHPSFNTNAYTFDVEISNCDVSGSYTGMGYRERDNRPDYNLKLHLFSDEHALFFDMYI